MMTCRTKEVALAAGLAPLLLLLLVLAPGAARAQEAPSPAARAGHAVAPVVRGCCTDDGAPPVLEATAVEGTILLDGVMDEPAWGRSAVATGFVQYEPDEGEPASERTEARVLYGAEALYVFMRAWDSRPDSIVGQVTRRDQKSYSDALGVVVDSYFDRRTAFHFSVNPAGVQSDVYRYDDTEEDAGWDAVWEVETARDPEGWSAEFRIPYSQLRFRDAPAQTWGINFVRELARREESSMWAPTSQDDGAIVSRFGELQGLRDLEPPRRLEIQPYTVGRLERAPGDPADPFYAPSRTFGTVGADVKYGLTSDLTLDLTLNPDFGQVEADPAQVNLSAFETFLPERRPFFLEGSSIFNFGIALGDGDGANESLFYSRRVGRAPHGSVASDDGWSDADDQTTILGAWKLSGKTAGGWSVGVLHAVTAREEARVAPLDRPGPESRYSVAVEPGTQYGVVRVQKDFREGRSAVGIIGTATRRSPETADDLLLHRQAFTGGVDFRHRFGGEDYQLQGYLLGSRVTGSSAALERTQRSATHYFQRPDAGHVAFDPERTRMDGASAFLSVAKIAGGHWRFSTGLHARSPGFEVNDLGYQRDADSWVNWAWVGYQQNSAQGIFRRYNLNLNGWTGWNWDGDHTGLGGNVNGSAQFTNYWSVYGGVNRDASTWSGRALRGGPLFREEASTNWWGGFGTDSRKAVHFNLSSWGNVRSESDSWRVGINPRLRFRPSARATVSVGTSLNRNVDDRQWVGRGGEAEDHLLFGRIDQTTVGLTLRADYAFSPTLSLQLYAEPFVSAGEYGGLKTVADPGADRYRDRFRPVGGTTDAGVTVTDLDGDGSLDSLEHPDFNTKQFRSNAVLRWEYLPGSTLFVVWSQGRDHFVERGDFDLGDDVDALFDVHPRNVFMVKVSYWLSR